MLTRCSGQLRLGPGGGAAVLGIDLGAVLSLAAALGYDGRAVAELVLAAEPVVVTALNERLAAQQD